MKQMLVGIAASVVLVAGCGGSSDTAAPATPTPATTTTATRTPKPSSTPTTMTAPVMVPVPTLLGLTANVVGQGQGFTTTAYDLGTNVVPARSGQPERAVVDKANWTVVAQCPVGGQIKAGGTVKIGVIKLSEAPAGTTGRAMSGEYNSLLTC